MSDREDLPPTLRDLAVRVDILEQRSIDIATVFAAINIQTVKLVSPGHPDFDLGLVFRDQSDPNNSLFLRVGANTVAAATRLKEFAGFSALQANEEI